MVKIGLEIHGSLNTKEKLFCPCKAIHGSKNTKPNTNICPICTAQPGAKPMLPNSEAIKKALEISLILKCKINKKLTWQRKHYDWADLPKGYQNTISGAHTTPNGTSGEFSGIKITECHLEEDPAAWNPKTGEIDYNRSGNPLIEIVTEPDFKSSEEVAEWLKKLKITLGYIKAIDKKSGLKADVNISLPEKNGERVEIKNVNSIKNIVNAIEYEIKRQSSPDELPKEQETRRYDETKNITTKMRSKEQADDYRFISDPDLPIIKIKETKITRLKRALPETPEEKIKKIIKTHNIPQKEAEILTKNLELVSLFEQVIEKIKSKAPLTLVTSWITIELQSLLNYNKKELDQIEIQPEHFAELIDLIYEKKLTELKAQEILRSWTEKSYSPKEKKESFAKISEKEIKTLTKRVIKENPKAVSDYKSGQEKAINFLIGQIMKLSEKRADFKNAKEVLIEELSD